ncbi:M15 family metallopeptidase [Cytobacillus purgationiresistens]|uniref:D-alanyl-D-alanine carboxypeptidase n=1 Tax=Cytobacillus purgationiresistens TaxID=863449 RepID=A0ABU0AVA7_9BACI|nr:M15 family metallopeptidase [Cytobacillus purgationiresistens]MDQ0273920.1 D-alanyl-D-alanine carboxypeptidase [Cytobacillus purgationiresistens]
MKKIMISTVVASVILGGCSQLDPYLDKIPFLSNADHNGSETTNENDNGKNDEEVNNEESAETSTNPAEKDSNNPVLEAAFFNDIEVVDDMNVIQNPKNVMALVNKQFSLPSDYIPNDLVRPNVAFSFGDEDIEKSYLRKEAADALKEMFEGAKAASIDLFAVSGYRSYDRQETVFNAEVTRVGEEKAVQVVAIPGSSEHQTGLSMDISSSSVNYGLTEEFEKVPEGKWLAENAHKYGFVLRYPKGKESITGYQFEPWHFRFVGKEAATVMFDKDWTLEEYFDIVEKI